MRRAAFLSTALSCAAYAASSSHASVSRAGVLSAVTGKHHLKGVDPAFECAWRSLAFEFAAQIQPFRPSSIFAQIHDGLELSSLCNQTFVTPAPRAGHLAVAAPPLGAAAATTLYVDFTNGDDSAAGTESAPMQHIAAAVTRARGLPAPAAVILRGGVHRLSSTLQLGAADSGLTITAYPGEQPVVSSGLVLKPTWAPAALADLRPEGGAPVRAAVGTATARASALNCTWQTFASEDSMFDDWPDSNIVNTSTAASHDACEARCQAASPSAPCYSWTWYDPAGQFGPQWDGNCFLRYNQVWSPSPQGNTWSGYCDVPPIPPNIYVADLSAAGTPIPSDLFAPGSAVLTLFSSPDGGATLARAFRARWPNADLEVDLFPKGWASGGERSGPPCNESAFNVTHVPLPENYGPGMFADYWWGEGGTCERFEVSEWLEGPPTNSYWCQPNGRTAGCTYLVGSPTSIALKTSELPHAPYVSDVVGNAGGIQYWRNGHWFSMMARIDGVSVDGTNTTTLSWTRGAFQGAEGDHNGEDFFVDHIKEELDAPREFFFEQATQKLWYFHNATAGTPPPPSWTWEVPALQVLINVSGSPSAPAAGITFSGITFTGAAATYLSAHGLPSGGDWGLSRLGAILVNGAQSLSVINNTFSRLDGNGVMLSGYNRNVTIDGNEFVWMGESAVASWGFTNGVDATAGLQPWFTRFTNNVCHEIGHHEKQTSCYFAATSAQATIANNIMFNMPRAAVNFNDDMAGGSLMTQNLVWNTCRESQDHGPFNSVRFGCTLSRRNLALPPITPPPPQSPILSVGPRPLPLPVAERHRLAGN